MNNKCEIKEQHKFLWFKWETNYTQHDWVYRDFEHRYCKSCNRNELYFGIDNTGGYYCEDWRQLHMPR